MIIGIYARKSVETGKGESIENQVKECQEYIERYIPDSNGAEIRIYKDMGYSGKSLDRPEFKRMMDETRDADFSYIICYRLDRISRNISDFSSLLDDLNYRGISFVSSNEQFDTATPMGKAMTYIASVFAQLERETIAERVRDNMRMLARTGQWLGGTTPTGFDSEKVSDMIIEGNMKTYYKLIENDEMPTIKTLFSKFFEFQSMSAVHRYLALNKIYSRTGKEFSMRTLKQIYTNPVYCIADQEARAYFISLGAEVCFSEEECSNEYGISAYNKRDYSKKNVPRNPVSEWIISVGKHKGIVKGSDWVYIQQRIEENKTSNDTSVPRNNYSLLSGLIYCKQCGSKMFAKMKTNSDRFYYICSRKVRGTHKLCNLKNLNGEQADDFVCQYLMDEIKLDKSIREVIEGIKANIKQDDNTNRIAEFEKEIRICEKEIANYIDNLSKFDLNDIMIKGINEKVKMLQNRIDTAKEKMSELQKNVNTVENDKLQVDIMARSFAYFKNNFQTLSLEDKRVLIRLLIQRIEWDGENLDIFLYGE